MPIHLVRWVPAISFALALSAHALGLGEPTVSSGLGQPLRASIALLGDETDIAADCFRVQAASGDLPLPADLALSLEAPGRGRAALRLTTRAAIDDPILGFVLIAECEGRLQKEYALLLDPAPPGQPPLAPPAAAGAAPRMAAPRPDSAPPRAALAGPERAPPRSAPKAGKAPPSPAAPRLVLSGARPPAIEGANGLPLKLDLTLPDPARARAARLSDTELSDEYAALNHKLAHLEQQLDTLRKRNAELLQRVPPAAEPKPAPGLSWPHFLLALVALSLLTALALRRRARAAAPARLRWPPATLPPQASVPTQPADRPSPPSASHDEDWLAGRHNGAEIHDSLEDEVEVFVAHGNAALAIRMLENHVRLTPADSPVPWLLLLDLLQRENLSEAYEATRRECKRYFNVALPRLSDMAGAAGEPGLEAYPHVMAELTRLWPGDGALPYLDELLRDCRNGSRTGFNLPAYNEIVLLRAVRAREKLTAPVW